MTEVDNEIRRYLRLLLDHSKDCPDETCPSHVLLHEICNMIRERIFSGPTLPVRQGEEPGDVRTRIAGGKS